MKNIAFFDAKSKLSTNCMTEVLVGAFSGYTKGADMIAFEEDVFGLLEDIVESVVPNFGHYAATEIHKKDWTKIIAKFVILVSELRSANQITDIKSPLYFHFQNTEIEFLSDFEKNKTKLANMTEELCKWLTDKLEKEDCITIVGM